MQTQKTSQISPHLQILLQDIKLVLQTLYAQRLAKVILFGSHTPPQQKITPNSHR